MGRPEITDDQREIAVEMLANAIRKDAHLRARARAVAEQGNPLTASMAKRRAEPSERYIAGMCDLIRVMFVDGGAVAESCLEDAYAQAMGVSPPPTDTRANFH